MRPIRTTVSLPPDLLDAAHRAVQAGRARSTNDRVVRALRRELADQARSEIDAAFAAMAADRAYQAEAERVTAEFTRGDWEAFQRGESPA